MSPLVQKDAKQFIRFVNKLKKDLFIEDLCLWKERSTTVLARSEDVVQVEGSTLCILLRKTISICNPILHRIKRLNQMIYARAKHKGRALNAYNLEGPTRL